MIRIEEWWKKDEKPKVCQRSIRLAECAPFFNIHANRAFRGLGFPYL
jgi:hypothetical protein